MNNVYEKERKLRRKIETPQSIKKNAIKLFYELGYDELGKEITKQFISKFESICGEATTATLTELDNMNRLISKEMTNARCMSYKIPQNGYQYKYLCNGEINDLW